MSNSRARVVLEKVKSRDGLDYVLSTAPPGEPLEVIAKFVAGGDATTYAQTVYKRLVEKEGAARVELRLPTAAATLGRSRRARR